MGSNKCNDQWQVTCAAHVAMTMFPLTFLHLFSYMLKEVDGNYEIHMNFLKFDKENNNFTLAWGGF